jgi:hypothetical protein
MKRFFALALTLALGASLAAQVSDPRSYKQIAATEKKTVVDYFLLCPAIVQWRFAGAGSPTKIGIAREARDFDASEKALAFRKSLLAVGGSDRGPRVSSVVVDQKNAYIRIDGVHQGLYAFSLVFVYFDRADKTAIPALTYHYTETEEIDDRHFFYDVRGGSWRPLPDESILPRISDAPLAPYAGPGDTSSTSWVLELPRYGTTIRFLPVRPFVEGEGAPEFAKGDAHLGSLRPYALECAWDKAQARFRAAAPALADKADIPKGAPVAADYFGLLRLPNAMDLALTDDLRRAARDAWKTSPKGQKLLGPNYFEWSVNEEIGDVGVQVAVLGAYKGLPLIGEVDRCGEVYSFGTFLYHADSGLLERAELISYETKDFYKPSRKAQATAAFGDAPPILCSIGLERDAPAFSFSPLYSAIRYVDAKGAPKELAPDYRLNFRWDDGAGRFVATTEDF